MHSIPRPNTFAPAGAIAPYPYASAAGAILKRANAAEREGIAQVRVVGWGGTSAGASAACASAR